MTDQQLIELVQNRLPHELSLEEIELIRRRMSESPHLREVLTEQLQLEQYLNDALGRVNVSVQDIVTRAGSGGRPRHPLLNLMGWGVCLLIVGFVSALLVTSRLAPPVADEAPLAAKDTEPEDDGEASHAAGGGADKGSAIAASSSPSETDDAVQPPGNDKSKPAAEAIAVATGREGGPVIRVAAEQFARGNAQIDTTHHGRGIGIVHSGGVQPSFVEYDILAPQPGKYQLQLRYASGEPRPLRVLLNGETLPDLAAAAATGGDGPEHQTTAAQGIVELRAGANVLRLESDSFLPHLDELALKWSQEAETHQAEQADSRLVIEAEKFDRGNFIIEKDRKDEAAAKIKPGTGDHHFVEYDVQVPAAGKYELELRSTGRRSVPLTLSINGTPVTDKVGLGGRRGGQNKAAWTLEGVVELQAGKNVLRLETSRKKKPSRDAVPQLDKLALSPAPADAVASAMAADETPKPWEDEAHLGGPERAWKEVAFSTRSSADAHFTEDLLKQWFSPAGAARFEDRRREARRAVLFDGRLKLQAPLDEEAVLRLTLEEYQGLEIHCFSGDRGVMLKNYGPGRRHAWVAYAIEAKESQERPVAKLLLDSDEDRAWRSGAGAVDAYQLAYRDGALTLLRGDVPLVRAPLEEPPTDLYLKGRAIVWDVAMFRAVDVPQREPTPNGTPVPSLLEAQWVAEVPAGAGFSKSSDGAVQLSAEKNQQPAWALLPITTDVPQEIILQVEDASPGSRVVLGDPSGKPKFAVGFFREEQTGGTALQFIYPHDGRLQWRLNPDGEPSPLASSSMWIKLLLGGGTLKCWSSQDGQHWTRAFSDPMVNIDGPCTSVGIECPPGQEKKSIALRQVSLRPLNALASLVPSAVREQAVQVDKLANYDVWKQDVLKAKPEGVNEDEWIRACAIRTLGAGTNRQLGSRLLDLLVDYAMEARLPPDEQLAVLEDAALVGDLWVDQTLLNSLVKHYGQVAEELIRTDEPAIWTQPSQKLRLAPVWTHHRYQVLDEEVIRAELYHHLYRRNWPEVQQLAAKLEFWNFKDPLVPWAQQLATQESQGGSTNYSVIVRSEHRHPLVEDLSKNGYNLLSELEAALENKAYRDACQIITSAEAGDALGLLPSFQDPGLLVSLASAIDLAMRQHPDLQTMMRNDFGPLGALRVRQAIAEQDEAAVRAATVNYFGSDAAAEAHLWLGDRSLAIGDLAHAAGHYEQAARSAGEEFQPQVSARQRLAAAMVGRDEGKPVAVPVKLGDTTLPPQRFESIVAAMRKRAATDDNVKTLTASAAAAATPVPPPGEMAAHLRARLEGEMGANPNEVPGKVRQNGIDWAARQLATETAGDALLVCNRFQLAAFDVSSGQRRWATDLDPEQTKTHDWSLVPMKPLVVGNRVFVRNLRKNGPELAAVELSSGKLLWNSKGGLTFVSDPLLVQNSLVALTMLRADSHFVFQLSQIDPETGAIVSNKELLTVRDSWWQYRNCQALLARDSLIFVFGGTVICCDISGDSRWARRQIWLPVQQDPDAVDQHHQAPLLVGERLYVAQPGVRSIEAIDVTTGRRHWQCILPNVQRMLGFASDHLIAETSEGLVGITSDGEIAWRHDDTRLLDGYLCGTGHVIYSRSKKVEKDPKYSLPELVWLDPTTGESLAWTALEALRDESPRFGPLVTAGNKLWAFYGRKDEPLRELVELEPTGKPAASERSAAALSSVSHVRLID